MPERVVFVCTGNTCRSPLAAAIAARLLAERGLAVAVASAGLAAVAGRPADPRAAAAAAARGLDLGPHRSRPVEAVQAGPGTLWLTMTRDQAAELRSRLGPGSAVEPLLPFARSLGAHDLPPGDDVADPFPRDERAYESVAGLLEAALGAVVGAWAAGRSQGDPPRVKTLALPRLGGLRPTLESTALKLLEEAGELAEGIGKFRALSGERARGPDAEVMTAIGLELLDVAQTAITMMFVLEEQYGVDVQALLRRHVEKLSAKGYLLPGADAPGAPGSRSNG
jgi:protein-tyrosine-phosphatase/NTP pyrophosphatase (non-canonical NTP hydrolase)